MKEAIINVQDLKKSFSNKKMEKTVLNGLNIKVQEGEIYALLGSNGSGKTTAINIMTGLEAADSGRVVINGYDLLESPEKVRESIALTGQFAAVDDILTGRENLELIAKLRKIKQSKQVVAAMLEKLSLTEHADKPLSTYSGGMKRRIDIAMSLIGSPKIIFLDEPTTGLDPEARQEIYKLIFDLVKAGTTIFLTTQYLEEAELLANKIAILHQGKIVAEGSFDELKLLFPKAKVEMVEKQPTLEEIFLNIVAQKGGQKNA